MLCGGEIVGRRESASGFHDVTADREASEFH